MVVAVSASWVSMLQGALVAAGLDAGDPVHQRRGGPGRGGLAGAHRHRRLFGLGFALEKTGAAQFIAENLIALAQGGPWGTLAVVYLVTMLFTELITNNAAAVLMFPIALSTSESLGVSFHAVRHRDHDGRLGELLHAHRLPVQSDGVRPRRLPLHRLLQGGGYRSTC